MTRSLTETVLDRIRRWSTDPQSVMAEARLRSRVPSPSVRAPPSAEAIEKATLSALRLGDVKKALQVLSSAPFAPVCPETVKALQALHPGAPLPVPLPPPLIKPPFFQMDLILTALASFGSGSGAGLFAYRPYILQQCAKTDCDVFLRGLSAVVNLLAFGEAPTFLQPFLAGGVSIALSKPNGGVRPLACGDPFRRLVGKCFCLGAKDDFAAKFAGSNFGVGTKGGVEIVAHTLRDFVAHHTGEGLAILKVDFRNAFNCVDRSSFLSAIHRDFPGLYSWIEWCYGSPSLLLYNHADIILSSCGVQQGDPLGPLLFSLALQPIVEEIQALNPRLNLWYLDDGVIVGSPQLLQQVWDIIRLKGPALGLFPNPTKCEWIWLDNSRSAPCPLYSGSVSSSIPVTALSDLAILGVPLGPPDIVSPFVAKKLLDGLRPLLDKLIEFEDSQAASFLLRVSFSAVRATHFMRTTPITHWRDVASSFDSSIRGAFEAIVGFPLSPVAYTQASLTPRLGGFGLRQVALHADGAFNASRSEVFCAWGPRLNWSSSPPPCPSQQESSFTLDSSLLSGLLSSAASPRERQRLTRVSQPHAGAWVTAVPSCLDGDALIRPRPFRISCRLRLGVPVWDKGASCPCCMQTLDIFGDHAICCTTNGDLIVRHNRIRDLVDKFAREGHLSPIMEKKGILGESKKPGRRRGDVTIPIWCEGKGLAVDVAVTCPFSSSNLSRDSPAEYCAAHLKHHKYDNDFKNTNFDFSAVIFESTGAVNREGKEFLAQLFRFAARYSGSHLSVYAGRAWARLSCTLQSSVAQSVINRMPEYDPTAVPLFADDCAVSISSVTILPADNNLERLSVSPVPPFVLRPNAPAFAPGFGSVSVLGSADSVLDMAPVSDSGPVPDVVPSSFAVSVPGVLPVSGPGSGLGVAPGSGPGPGPSPTFTSSSFRGSLSFFPCPASSSNGLHCPRGSFVHAPYCRFHLRSVLGLDVVFSHLFPAPLVIT